MTDLEYRSAPVSGLLVTEERAGLPGERFVGHAAVFNTRTAIGNPLTWGFYEQVRAGAFAQSLATEDVRMLIDHDPYFIVARSSAGTLRLAEDTRGLAVDAALNDELSYVRDLKVNLRSGNLTGMPFAFEVLGDEWTTDMVATRDGHVVEVELRTLTEVRLVEVSAVAWPAYPTTDAGLKI